MQDVNLKLLTAFVRCIRIPMQYDFECSMEWKLFDSINGHFNPVRILTSSMPYKFNQ